MHAPHFTLAALTCIALTASASAQSTRKPGLWDVTTTMTWQQAPFPAGMPAPGAGTTTTPVCLTQQQIDKYGAITPSLRPGCSITNVVKDGTSMTADMVCTGSMNGKATVQSSLIDSDHAAGKAHFTGTLQMGPNVKPVEWSTVSSSVFKGPDCGSVKPRATSDK